MVKSKARKSVSKAGVKKSGKAASKISKKSADKARFPLLPTYEHVLKCSHLFNTLDSRGAISVTERVAVIARVRKVAVGVAGAWMDQQSAGIEAPKAEAEVVR